MSNEAFAPYPPHVFLSWRKLVPQDGHLSRIVTLTILDKGKRRAVDQLVNSVDVGDVAWYRVRRASYIISKKACKLNGLTG